MVNINFVNNFSLVFWEGSYETEHWGVHCFYQLLFQAYKIWELLCDFLMDIC